jgi:hypothetical protein
MPIHRYLGEERVRSESPGRADLAARLPLKGVVDGCVDRHAEHACPAPMVS